jgi:hypothetical protein
MPNESSFLSVFFQKEAAIMKKMHCNDYDAKPPGWRKSAKSRLVIAGTFCCTRRVSSTGMKILNNRKLHVFSQTTTLERQRSHCAGRA